MKLLFLILSIVLLSGCGFSSKWVKPMEQGDYAALEKNIAENGVKEVDGDGYTPLHHASRVGDLKAIQLLVSAGADIHAYRSQTTQVTNPTPLSMALAHGQYEAAKLLIDLGAANTENVKVSAVIKKTYIDTGLIPVEQLLMPADVLIVYHTRYGSNESRKQAFLLMEYLFGKGFKPTSRMVELNYHSVMSPAMLKLYLKHGGKKYISQTWSRSRGDTALFRQSDSENIGLLLKYGADPAVRNDQGNTAFHDAVLNAGSKGESLVKYWIAPFLDANMDPFLKNRSGKTVLEYAVEVGNPVSVKRLQAYEDDFRSRRKADEKLDSCEIVKGLDSQVNCYQEFLVVNSDHVAASAAKKRYELLNKKRIQIQEEKKKQQRLARIKRQACKLKNQDWEYLSKSCKNGYANGSGIAVNEDKNLKFIGEFYNGQRMQGEIYAFDELMYDGPLKDDRPHGTGTCMHEGEPEECKFYKGKRTDVLYKQRIEFTKQREMLASTEQRINQSLKATEDKIDQKLANIQSGSDRYNSSEATDMVTEAIKKKAADKAADFLFDQLF